MDNLERLRETHEERPLDWRWRRAITLEDRKAPVRKIEDPQVIEARRFLRKQRQGETSEALAKEFPVLYEVSRIYDEASTTRWTLEAFIMANVAPADVGGRFGWTTHGEAIVEAYETFKFDIRSRLKFDSFVIANLLGFSADAGMVASEEKIWKTFAWLGFKKKMGTALLDGYMNIDVMPDDIKRWYEQFIDHHIMRKTVRSLIKFDPMQNERLMILLGTYHDSQRLGLERKMKGADLEASRAEKTSASLVEALTMTTASIGDLGQVPQIEPRAADMLLESVNKQIIGESQDKLKKVGETNAE